MCLNLAEDDAVYVGVIPATLGMLFLPFLRRVGERWIRFFMAVTIGLLGFLAVDAYLEAPEIAEPGTGAFGGAELLFIGAGAAYLGLEALGIAAAASAPEAKNAIHWFAPIRSTALVEVALRGAREH